MMNAGIGQRKAQGSLEYLIIIAAVLAISAIVVLFVTGAFGGASSSKDISLCKATASNCGNRLAGSPGSTCSECETSCASGSSDPFFAVNLCKLGLTQSILSDPNLVSGFHLDEGSGTVSVDNVAQNNQLRLVVSSWHPKCVFTQP